jgi:hypothetical protein
MVSDRNMTAEVFVPKVAEASTDPGRAISVITISLHEARMELYAKEGFSAEG